MKRIVFALLVLFMITMIGCHNSERIVNKEIYIPILADESWLLADGAFINGVNLAAEEFNEKNVITGYNVRTEILDDQALYEEGVEAAINLSKEEKFTAVFNLQNFNVSKTTADILSEKKHPVIFPYGAYDSIFLNNNPYLFCGVASFSDIGRAMANYAIESGYKRIAVYHNGLQSQEELVIAFELELLGSGAGAKVVDYVPSISSQSEFEEIYERWQAIGVDCIVISQYGLDEAFNVLNMIRNKDKDIAIIGEPIFNRANALHDNKEAAEGMIIPSTLVMEDSAELKAFKLRYKEKYQIEADIWAIQGYDMLSMLVDSVVNLDTKAYADIAEALHKEEGYQGVGRNIAYQNGGSMLVDYKELTMLVCRDGSFIDVNEQ